jgi:hypothetical protein
VSASRELGSEALDALDKQSTGFPAALMPAPVRPLNNIAAPALAVEISPEGDDASELSNGRYQQAIASALAAALATVQPHSAAGGQP